MIDVHPNLPKTMKITIRHALIETRPLGHDQEYERRIFLADRVRERASVATLGGRFVVFTFAAPDPNVRGPQSVDFDFSSTRVGNLETDTARLLGVVKDFMAALKQV